MHRVRVRIDNAARSLLRQQRPYLHVRRMPVRSRVMNSISKRTLLALVLTHAAASLVHFVHNAAFLGDYPNMPAWISPLGIYGVWLAEAGIGALGVWSVLRGRSAGLVLIAIYALLGLAGLDHYALAPMSAHTLVMNATIWLETITAIVLLGWIGATFVVRRAQC